MSVFNIRLILYTEKMISAKLYMRGFADYFIKSFIMNLCYFNYLL